MYGGVQESRTWVYGTLDGASSSVRLGDRAVELRPQVEGPLALPGSLSVNGAATFVRPTSPFAPKLSVSRLPDGRYSVTGNDASVLALYATDGRGWNQLGTGGGAGTLTTPVSGLQGAGRLTPDEARALSGALLGQGPLVVAVLDPARVPDAPLKVEPIPSEYLRTALYVMPQGGSAAATPGVPVTFTEIASGTQSGATAFTVRLANSAASAQALYALAYARQTPPTPAPALGADNLVGVFLGQRTTGGYGVKVLSARTQDGVLTLQVRLSAPGPGMLTTQALTSPWVIVRVPGGVVRVDVVDEAGQRLGGS